MTRRNGRISLAERVARHAPGAPEMVPTVDGEVVPSLEELAATANRYIAEAEQAMQSGAESARQAGLALLAAKAQLKHGQWLPWLAKHFNRSADTAQVCMRLAKTENSRYLESAQSVDSALKAIRGPRPKRQPQPDVPAPTPEPGPQSTMSAPPQPPADQPRPAAKCAESANLDGADQSATPAPPPDQYVPAAGDEAQARRNDALMLDILAFFTDELPQWGNRYDPAYVPSADVERALTEAMRAIHQTRQNIINRGLWSLAV
jgi:hypothetical protein